MRKCINLYHITSHPMWYDIEAKKLIEGREADRISRIGKKMIGFMKFEQAPIVNYHGRDIRAYGQIFEL